MAGGTRLLEPVAICNLTTIQIPHRYNTSMDFRDSVSKPFEKLKHRFKELRRKREGGTGKDTRGGGENDNEASETGQGSCLPPEAEGMAENGPVGEKGGGDKEVVQVNPPTSAPPISPNDSGGLDGARSMFLGLSRLSPFFQKT